MINEMGHTSKVKCTPAIACAQDVEASGKERRRSDWLEIGGGFFGNENDVMRCKCRMPASQQATSAQH